MNSKLLLCASVLVLSACSSAGTENGGSSSGGSTALSGFSFSYPDFPPEAMKAKESDGTTDKYAEFVRMDGDSALLNFGTDGKIKQVVMHNNAVREGTWASVEFNTASLTPDAQGIISSTVTQQFNMFGAGSQSGLSYEGTTEATLKLGGKGIGLKYGDFGFMMMTVTGEYKEGSTRPKTQNFTFNQTFYAGNSNFTYSDTSWVNNIETNKRMVFKGKALASGSGTLGTVTFSGSDGIMTGEALMDFDKLGTIGLALDFTAAGKGLWEFRNTSGTWTTKLNGTALTDATPEISSFYYASSAEAARPDEIIGQFGYDKDEANWFAGTFGVNNPTVESKP